jgi:hypothetical protein
MDPRIGLDALEKRNILRLTGIELRPSSPSLYRYIQCNFFKGGQVPGPSSPVDEL